MQKFIEIIGIWLIQLNLKWIKTGFTQDGLFGWPN